MVRKIIQKYIQENRSCVAWKIDKNNHLLYCELFPTLTSKDILKLKVPSYSLENLIEIIGSQEKILLYFEEDGLIEVGLINDFNNPQEIELKLLNEFEQLNRRSGERFSFKKLIQVTIESKNGLTDRYYGHDLSEMGLSIVLLQNQKNAFSKGDTCMLKIGEDNPLIQEVEVVAVSKMKPFESQSLPYSKYKIAFKFTKRNESWAETILMLSGLKIK
jgi:hypothetical protein